MNEDKTLVQIKVEDKKVAERLKVHPSQPFYEVFSMILSKALKRDLKQIK